MRCTLEPAQDIGKELSPMSSCGQTKNSGWSSSALRRFFLFVCFCAILVPSSLLIAPAARAADKSAMSAEDLMRLLPTSIFDNTSAPISQDELDLLLTRGYIDAWVVVENKRDVLRMTATGDSPGEVQLQVLRAAPRSIVILGARSDDACASELWEYRTGGGLVPYAAPPGPSAQDFFALTKTPPRGLIASYSFCLEAGMLEAVPRFWNADGPVDITPDNRIFYIWNGEDFVQRTAPAADVGAVPAPPLSSDRPPSAPSSPQETGSGQ